MGDLRPPCLVPAHRVKSKVLGHLAVNGVEVFHGQVIAGELVGLALKAVVSRLAHIDPQTIRHFQLSGRIQHLCTGLCGVAQAHVLHSLGHQLCHIRGDIASAGQVVIGKVAKFMGKAQEIRDVLIGIQKYKGRVVRGQIDLKRSLILLRAGGNVIQGPAGHLLVGLLDSPAHGVGPRGQIGQALLLPIPSPVNLVVQPRLLHGLKQRHQLLLDLLEIPIQVLREILPVIRPVPEELLTVVIPHPGSQLLPLGDQIHEHGA